MKKVIIRKECTVGSKCWYKDEPNKVWYEQGRTENGWCFKDAEAYESKEAVVCYIPENDDYWNELDEDFENTVNETDGNTVTCGYTYSDFLDACDGVPPLADKIFYEVDWQYPETLLNEWSDDDTEEAFHDVTDGETNEFLHSLAVLYDEQENGYDWSNYYNFYLQHKKH